MVRKLAMAHMGTFYKMEYYDNIDFTMADADQIYLFHKYLLHGLWRLILQTWYKQLLDSPINNIQPMYFNKGGYKLHPIKSLKAQVLPLGKLLLDIKSILQSKSQSRTILPKPPNKLNDIITRGNLFELVWMEAMLRLSRYTVQLQTKKTIHLNLESTSKWTKLTFQTWIMVFMKALYG